MAELNWRESDKGNWSASANKHKFIVWKDRRGEWSVSADGVFIADRWPTAEEAKAIAEQCDATKLEQLQSVVHEALGLT